MLKSVVSTLLLICFTFLTLSNGYQPSDLSQSNHAFSIKLFKDLYKDVSLVFSPTNIGHCLSALLAGLRGTTFDELFQGLQYHLSPDLAKVKSLHGTNQLLLQKTFLQLLTSLEASGNISISAGLYSDNTFYLEDIFVQAVSHYYKSQAKSVDFHAAPENARNIINEDVSRATKGLIEDLMGPGSVTTDTKVVLTSTIHFEDHWTKSFNAKMSAERDFHRDNGETVSLKMMHGRQRQAYHEEPMVGGTESGDENLKVLKLPYLTNRFAFYTIMPPAKTMPTLVKGLTVEKIKRYIKSVQPVDVQISIPIFQTLSDLNLVKTLEHLGVQTIFKPGGDFTGLSKDPRANLYVSTLVHKALLKVNENGTVAAAATGAGVSITSLPPFNFVANKPFMYLLYDHETDHILFMGAYTGH